MILKLQEKLRTIHGDLSIAKPFFVALLTLKLCVKLTMTKIITAFLVFVCFSIPAFSQSDSCSLRISLLTCSPGTELYSIFGHSAIRVKDVSTNTDIIFNYGTFDFNDPDFYTKFMRGRLLYFVSIEGYSDFAYAYELEERNIEEQLLNLSCSGKEKLFAALRLNSEQVNKFYAYDFFYDNCSTRLRDIIANHAGDKVLFRNILPADRPTFRNMIHEYLNKSEQYWSKLGMDLLMGTGTDKKVTNSQSMFLPDYLQKGVDSAVIGKTPLVSVKIPVLNVSDQHPYNKSWFTPLVVFSFLLLVGILPALLPFLRRAVKPMQFFDLSLFGIVGLMGIVMSFMWFGTEHKICRDNMNLIWAWPTHFIIAFFLHKSRRVVKYYFGLSALTGLILLIGWKWWPQEFNPSLIPLVALIVYRSFRIYKKI